MRLTPRAGDEWPAHHHAQGSRGEPHASWPPNLRLQGQRVPKRGSRQGTGVLHWITKCGRCLGSSRRRVEARLLRTQDSPGRPRGAQATHRAASSARL